VEAEQAVFTAVRLHRHASQSPEGHVRVEVVAGLSAVAALINR
jgi:hypothetical protein